MELCVFRISINICHVSYVLRSADVRAAEDSEREDVQPDGETRGEGHLQLPGKPHLLVLFCHC